MAVVLDRQYSLLYHWILPVPGSAVNWKMEDFVPLSMSHTSFVLHLVLILQLRSSTPLCLQLL